MAYRGSIPEKEKVSPPPFDHTYAPVHRRAWNMQAPGCLVLVPFAVGAVVASLGFPLVALVAIVVTAIALWFWHKRDRARGRAYFSVVRDRLSVRFGGRTEDIPLEDLVDVVLDTKTVERMQEGSTLVPALAAINATVGPPADTARIVIETKKGSFPLTDDYLSYTETVDEIAKVRVFLRKHGWVPDDERVEVPKKKKKKKKKL